MRYKQWTSTELNKVLHSVAILKKGLTGNIPAQKAINLIHSIENGVQTIAERVSLEGEPFRQTMTSEFEKVTNNITSIKLGLNAKSITIVDTQRIVNEIENRLNNINKRVLLERNEF